jgi:hypothetical protein
MAKGVGCHRSSPVFLADVTTNSRNVRNPHERLKSLTVSNVGKPRLQAPIREPGRSAPFVDVTGVALPARVADMAKTAGAKPPLLDDASVLS